MRPRVVDMAWLVDRGSELADWATILGVGVAAIALVITARQSRLTAKATQRAEASARGTMWLELRQMFDAHREVHEKLRPKVGQWADTGPRSISEWVSVELYMGLFEQCERLIRAGVLDAETFTALYRYRMGTIVANETIRREKLIERAAGWRDFRSLMRRMDIPLPEQSRPDDRAGGDAATADPGEPSS